MLRIGRVDLELVLADLEAIAVLEVSADGRHGVEAAVREQDDGAAAGVYLAIDEACMDESRMGESRVDELGADDGRLQVCTLPRLGLYTAAASDGKSSTAGGKVAPPSLDRV